MTILFVRHGESLANHDPLSMVDVPNHMSPLTEKGWAQARETGAFLKDYYAVNPPQSNVRLWVSPFIRATQTALGMLDTCGDMPWDVSRRGHVMQFDDRLRERESVYFEGYSHEENERKFPEQIAYFKRIKAMKGGHYYARPYGGEHLADLSLRIHSFLSDLFHDIDRGVTEHVIVAHGNLLQAFILTITKTHPFFIDEIRTAPNGGVHLFDIDARSGRYEDFGLLFDADKGVRLVQKPAQPHYRDIKPLLEKIRQYGVSDFNMPCDFKE